MQWIMRADQRGLRYFTGVSRPKIMALKTVGCIWPGPTGEKINTTVPGRLRNHE